MAPKTKEQFTVIIEGLFLNDTRPAEWKQDFPWSASIGLHYRPLNEEGVPEGETVKKYLKHLWLFQAMGGKNAVGHYYRLEAEHGMLPAKDGNPEKPYTSIMPLAEVFADGTAKFLEAPKDGKVGVPSGAKPGPAPPVQPKGPAGPKAPASTTPITPSSNGNGEKKLPWLDTFMKKVTIPQSDEWWASKEAFNLDGAIISNSFQYAATFLQNLQGNDQEAQAAIIKWAEFFETTMRETKAERCRARLGMYLGLCTDRGQVSELVYKSWTMLPKSHFDAFCKTARNRAEELPKIGSGEPLNSRPTPEIQEEEPAHAETEEDIPF